MINIPQFTVSEFSSSIKRVVEDAFGYVKIKGEVSGFKKATSGHLYFNLKDNNAVLSAVFFRQYASALNFEIGDGLEIVVSGRITTFEGRSNYQIIVEKAEIAGLGAILEMIEKRRQKLLAEGLFDERYKKPIPFFPKKIAVITSPTGAVIEDIKHRIMDRCPTHLLFYPVAVQGEKSAFEVIKAVKFFNNLAQEKRPDVIIIARGGGSIEDLMSFNDENLVREIFKCEIPVISAIGHETDFTLIDYVADLRAPTPTAAAELATPVLKDLLNQINFLAEKLRIVPQRFLHEKDQQVERLFKFIPKPILKIQQMNSDFAAMNKIFYKSLQDFLQAKNRKLEKNQISNQLIYSQISLANQKIKNSSESLQFKVLANIERRESQLKNLEKIMKSLSYEQILKRGFSLIKNKNGQLISAVSEVEINQEISVEMYQGRMSATVNSKDLI